MWENRCIMIQKKGEILFMDAALQVPTIPNRKRIPQPAIQSVVDQIIALVHPQKIILFGSYAYGSPCPESDVDLLVIMESNISEGQQTVAILQNIQYRFGLDLLVITPEKLTQRLALGDDFLKEITAHGKVMYESTCA